ncbi:MAG: Calx-beta domain-containing protein [Candidatus Peribacteraceae bacterium]|nr:Calx-beta domain-containing protein [Candidatus Peribacteraceae bacterium]
MKQMQWNGPLVVMFLVGMFAGAVLTSGVGAAFNGSAVFPDVPAGAFYDQAVGEMYGAGIIRGYDNGRFGPDDVVTRGQLAVMLQRLRNDINGISNDTATSTSSAARRSSSARSMSSSSVSSVAITSAGGLHFTSSSFSIPDTLSTLTISVIRTGGSRGAVAVGYTVGGGTAVAGTDYTATTGVLSFADGETAKNIKIYLINNDDATGNRTMDITLSSPTGGAVLTSPATATVTLQHSGASGSSASGGTNSSASSAAAITNAFSFSAVTYAVMENSSTATFTVVRSGSTSGSANVEFFTTNGSATSGSNFEQKSEVLSFASGDTTKTFTLVILDNGTSDGSKSFTVGLRNTTGGVGLGVPSSATVTIMDDESVESGSGIVKFAQGANFASNSDGTAYVRITRAGGYTGTASATYETFDDTAQNGVDYNRVSGTLTFAPGEMQKYIVIPLIRHSTYEGEKSFRLRINSVSGNSIMGSPSDATLTIEG